MALPRQNGGVLMEFRPMSPEEIERTVQFLLHQQAKFAADFDKQSAKTDRMTEAILGLTSTVGRVTDDVGQLTDSMGRLTDRVAGVADGLIGLTGIVGRVTERLEQLAGAQQLTDQQVKETSRRVSEVIEMFERHRREDHGHRPS